jgi:hypothetical protein
MLWWLIDTFLDGDRRPLVVVASLVAVFVVLVVLYA